VPIAMALARLRKKLDAEGVTRLIKNRHSRLYGFTPPGQARRTKSIMVRRREGEGAHWRGLAELRRDATGSARRTGCRGRWLPPADLPRLLHAARLARWRSIRAQRRRVGRARPRRAYSIGSVSMTAHAGARR
jgi:hypothetical protein